MDSRGQKLRIFRKRKMPLTYIGHLKMGFYKVFNKKSCKKLFRQLRKKESLTEIRLYSYRVVFSI